MLTPNDPAATEAAAMVLPDPPSADFHNFEKGYGPNDKPTDPRGDWIDRQEADAKPDPKKLIGQIRQTITDCSDYYQRLACAHDWRNCLWSGQSINGRKNQANLDRAPSPWEGASDTRIRIIDEICNDNVVRFKHAFFSGDMQAQSHTVTGMAEGQASDASTLLRYVMRQQMQPEIADEIEFIGQWQEEFGSSVNHISWDRQTRMEPQTVTVDEMVQASLAAAVQEQTQRGVTNEEHLKAIAQESVEETKDFLLDPDNEANVVSEILTWAPHLSPKQAKVIAKELRDTGTSTFPSPRVAIDRPAWTALRPMLDVWFPRETENIKRAAWIARTEFLTLDELRDSVATRGWNPEFVDEVQQHRGSLFDIELAAQANLYSRGLITTTASGTVDDDYAHLFQIIRMYYRAVDAKGFPAIHEAILHPDVDELCGKYGLLEGAHSDMPFVAHRRERRQRPIIESRGVPELAFTQQLEIKTQRDSRTDRTELATSPPLLTPLNRGGGAYDLRPGHQLPRKRSDPTIEFLAPPSFDLGTIEIEDSTMEDLNRYFGRIGKDTPDPSTAQLKQQDGVNNFLNSLTSATKLSWSLMQQYMPETTVSRVVGGQTNSMQFTREDIEGAYQFTIAFDVRDLDNDFLIKKLEAISQIVIPLDTAGVVDRAGLAKLLLRAIDPTLAEQITKDPQQAQADETENEKQALTMISAGVEPTMVEGQDHELRLKVLTEAVQNNQELMERAQDGEGIFGQLLQNRMKHHQFQLEQRKNAQIGRVGAGTILS